MQNYCRNAHLIKSHCAGLVLYECDFNETSIVAVLLVWVPAYCFGLKKHAGKHMMVAHFEAKPKSEDMWRNAPGAVAGGGIFTCGWVTDCLLQKARRQRRLRGDGANAFAVNRSAMRSLLYVILEFILFGEL